MNANRLRRRGRRPFGWQPLFKPPQAAEMAWPVQTMWPSPPGPAGQGQRQAAVGRRTECGKGGCMQDATACSRVWRPVQTKRLSSSMCLIHERVHGRASRKQIGLLLLNENRPIKYRLWTGFSPPWLRRELSTIQPLLPGSRMSDWRAWRFAGVGAGGSTSTDPPGLCNSHAVPDEHYTVGAEHPKIRTQAARSCRNNSPTAGVVAFTVHHRDDRPHGSRVA